MCHALTVTGGNGLPGILAGSGHSTLPYRVFTGQADCNSLLFSIGRCGSTGQWDGNFSTGEQGQQAGPSAPSFSLGNEHAKKTLPSDDYP